MTRAVLVATTSVSLVLALAGTTGAAGAAVPFEVDSMGPITDVTAHWPSYQPARAFCIKPDAPQLTPGGSGASASGHERACRRSGFAASASGLYEVHVAAPALCAGCRRLFIDFSKIPAASAPPDYYARGHVYYHLLSANPFYTVDPLAHSPNTKNFTNDKLLSPNGSLQELLSSEFDLHAIAYVTDTAQFVHNSLQGPYYAGPWYLNRAGRRIFGVYLDVNLASAPRLPVAMLDAISYADGFNAGLLCPSDVDLLYAGCLDWFGVSASSIDPFG